MRLMNVESDGPRGGRQFYWWNEKYEWDDRGEHCLLLKCACGDVRLVDRGCGIHCRCRRN